MAEKYVMALDQGTTSSRAVIFNRRGQIVSIAAQEFRQIYPRPGWVEHDPLDIWRSQKEAAQRALRKARVSASSNRRRWDHQPAGDHPRLGPRDRPALSQRDCLAMPPDRGAGVPRSKKSPSPGRSGRRPAWWWMPIFPGRSWSGFWKMRRGLAGRPKRGRRFSARSTPGWRIGFRERSSRLRITPTLPAPCFSTSTSCRGTGRS